MTPEVIRAAAAALAAWSVWMWMHGLLAEPLRRAAAARRLAGDTAGSALSGEADSHVSSGVSASVLNRLRRAFRVSGPVRAWYRIHGSPRADDVPELDGALLAMSAAVGAGLSLPQAIQLAANRVSGPFGEFWLRAAGRYQAGEPLVTALSAPGAPQSPDYRFFLQALRLHQRLGGPLERTLAAISDAVAERRAYRREAAARTVEARLTANVLALAPIVLAGYLLAMRPDFLRPLLREPTGVGLLAYAAASWLAGLVLVKRLVAPLR